MFVRLKIRDHSHVHASFFLFQLSVRPFFPGYFFVRRVNPSLSLAHSLLLSVVRSTLIEMGWSKSFERMQHVKLLFMWSVGGTTLLLTNQVKDGVMRVTIMGREGVNCPCSGSQIMWHKEWHSSSKQRRNSRIGSSSF